jgi:CRISPR-associated endonuclease/helicase Cas3
MWRTVLPPATQAQLAARLGVDEASAEWWVCFWAGLHDIGKCSPAFAQVNEPRKAALAQAGFRFYGKEHSRPHGMISAHVLRDTLVGGYGMQPKLARRVATLVGGHHGVFPSKLQVNDAGLDTIAGKGRWTEARAAVIDGVARGLGARPASAPFRMDNSTALVIAGLISVADWIGSNTDFFGYAVTGERDIQPSIEPDTYLRGAIRNARDALHRLGWLGWTSPSTSRQFATLFPQLPGPNAMQEEVIRQANQLAEPNMFIVEVPMGEGKSEAAMYLADRWSATLAQRGCYFALPTMATSDQMFNRVHDFLATTHPDEIVNLQLLHGRSAMSAEFEELLRHGNRLFAPSAIQEDSGQGTLPSVVATEWFTYRNRGLLSPCAVGTVDQALLAVLQTKHVFVRTLGLANKTLIVDEVHAYDTYMTTLLERLLEWEGACGSSVVLLSATLPEDRRRQLVGAYLRGQQVSESILVPETPYPRVTSASASGVTVRTVNTSTRSRKEISLRWIDGQLPSGSEAFTLGERLCAALADGGCVAVICNTVDRAQRVYRALESYFPGEANDRARRLDLFHARFLFRERDLRARRSMRRFGKPDGTVALPDGGDVPVQRPDCAVLVATQVVEQSLDLDFDLMVTDWAPVDLLLQRAGRLHRHERRERPNLLREPYLWVVAPHVDDAGVPRFDPGTATVYDRHVLLRSWLALRGYAGSDRPVRVPEDVEMLIESVYAERDPPPEASNALVSEWDRTRCALLKVQERHAIQAEAGCILSPVSANDILAAFNQQLEEENPDVHRALRAQTRLGDDSVNVIFLSSEEWEEIPAGAPGTPEARALLDHSVPIADRRVVHELIERDCPKNWSRSPLLRHSRLVLLDLEEGPHANRFGHHRFVLHDDLGLTVTTHGKED